MENQNNKIYKVDINKSLSIDLYATSVNAGFPSPAEDHMDIGLDLNEYLISNPVATFIVKANGTSMIDANIRDQTSVPPAINAVRFIYDASTWLGTIKMYGVK